MFIKKLYSYSKLGCTVFIAFIVFFVYINYKWGLVATPVYQLGMFSQKFHVNDTQTVYNIYVDDKLLDITKYAFARRDMLLVMLQKYQQQKAVNQSVYSTIKKLPAQINMGTVMRPDVYLNNIDDKTFTDWYKKLLYQVTGEPVRKLEVYSQKIIWAGNGFQKIDSPQKLQCIVAD